MLKGIKDPMTDQVKKKALTPSKFLLSTMKALTSSQIAEKFNAKIDSIDITPAVKNACVYTIKKSAAGQQTFKAEFTGLSPQDIGIITSDFGEISGCLYMLNSNKKYTHANFPTDENEQLVDYYLVRDGIDEKVSAKAGEGGAPAIKAVESALNAIDPKTLSTKKLKALTVLKLIIEGTLYGGVLEAAKYLGLPGYKALTVILANPKLKTGYSGNTIPSQEVLIKAVNAGGSLDSCLKLFNSLFVAANFKLGGDAGFTKMKSVFDGTAGSRYKKWGILHFPITSEVMGWLNTSDNEARELLTLAARTLTVNQIYLDYRGGNLTYTLHTFSDADFKFHSPSSTPNPVGNRIGMKMIKGGVKTKK
jgi:hypothetical protein